MTKQFGESWRPPDRGRWSAEDGRAMLAALATSDQSQSAFAKSRGFHPQRIPYWRGRLLKVDGAPGFKQASVVVGPDQVQEANRTGAVVEVLLERGKTLRFVGDLTRAQLVSWLEALETIR